MIDQKLLTLIEVSKTLNFTKAGLKLGLTQPAVSTHIKLLEDEFNIKIFNKREKKLIFTEEGEILLRFAKRSEALYNQLDEQLENSKKQIRSLTIGMTHTAENSELPTVLANYAQQKQDSEYSTNIKIISDSIKKIYDKLKNYTIDVAIVEGRFPDKDFKTVLIDTDSLVLIVGNKNPLSKKQVISLQELQKENLILRLANSDSRKRFESAIHNVNMTIKDFNVILELDSISVIKNLVENNYGVSIISKSACLEEIKQNKFKTVNIENLSMIRELNIIYHQDFMHQEFINDFILLYNELQK